MTAFVAAYPPLGQVTQLQDPNVEFYVVLEVPKELAEESWQLSLWHSTLEGGEWTETLVLPVTSNIRPADLHEASGERARLYFTAKLTVESSLNFTVKFRLASGQEWRWVRDEQGVDDGLVVISSKSIHDGDTEGLPDLIKDLNPDLKVESHASQTPKTRLWSLEAAVDGAKDDKSTFVEVPLGLPWGGFLRWFALVKPWAPWLAPRQGKSSFKIENDAMLCSFLSPQGKHLVFLGMSGANDVVTMFRSAESGHLNLYIRNDNTAATTGAALVAVGDDIASAIAAVMYHARTLVTGATSTMAEAVAEATPQGDIRPAWYENWYDGLGYCTWNSLGQELTEEKVLHALDTLAENNIKISSLIIDDNWQDIDYRGDGQWQYGWNDFEAEPKTFPRGLKALISDIRSKHKNIQHIAIWHTLLGYWAGLAPNGPLAKRYQTVTVTRDDADKSQLPIDGLMTLVAPSSIPAFYNDFYRFLSSCGIDGVKTDGQYMLDTVVAPSARRSLIASYLDAWTLASLRHFSGRVISCMSQAPPLIFHSQLPHNRPPIVYRNSDDYFPAVPEAQPFHVWANAHNALLTQHLNVIPDWDMFQTVHDYAGFHAAARVVSGGPVYITDVPGQHDLDLIRQISAVTTRGRTVVLRPSVLGRTLEAYNGYDDGDAKGLLKVGAYHGRAVEGTGIVGLFNVSKRELMDAVPLGRFPGVVEGRRYVVRAHGTGRVSKPVEVGTAEALMTVKLGARGYDVLCAYPLTAVASKTRGEVLLANLGLMGKMMGCAAVLRTVYEVRENGRMLVDATLKALGVLGIYISALPEVSIEDNFMVTIQGQPIPPRTVSVNKQDRHVLDVDIETAWKEMGLESGWSNEVEVKVYFGLEKK
ncbi:hypothetical protein VTI74DRAFT_7789 [Chaetomium olivicolor]